jgi:ion channel
VAPAGSGALARRARYRYGAVFVIALALLVFEIVAPEAAWARATGLALEAAALVVVVATSRDRASVRRARAIAAGAAGAIVVALVWLDVLGRVAVFALSGALAVCIAVAVVLGAGRVILRRGVTREAVAGGLTVYLMVGLLFSWIVLLAGELGAQPYFAGGQPLTPSTSAYYSFTVLTTTGFGDFVAAQRSGHAIAVVEMLTGQLYLVTVIGIVVGNFRGRSGGPVAR